MATRGENHSRLKRREDEGRKERGGEGSENSEPLKNSSPKVPPSEAARTTALGRIIRAQQGGECLQSSGDLASVFLKVCEPPVRGPAPRGLLLAGVKAAYFWPSLQVQVYTCPS